MTKESILCNLSRGGGVETEVPKIGPTGMPISLSTQNRTCSGGGIRRLVLLWRSAKSNPLHGVNHLFGGDDTFLIRHSSEPLLKTHLSACDAFQPLQGLLNHKGSDPSGHAVNPQVGDGRL